jgi:hypothetical protein
MKSFSVITQQTTFQIFTAAKTFYLTNFNFYFSAASLTSAATGELDAEGCGLSSLAFSPWSSAELESSPQ